MPVEKRQSNCNDVFIEAIDNKYQDMMSKIEFVSRRDFLDAFQSFKAELNAGQIRAAEKQGDVWCVNSWVKKFILMGFKYGSLQETTLSDGDKLFDKETLGTRNFEYANKVRIVSRGVTIRDGSFVAVGVTCMPPCFINIGAYVDEETMVDSNALVGSCAQIGKRVHIGAAAQIGGVLEPVGDLPVIIEDNVFVGGNSGIYDGVLVKKGAIIGAGTIITGSVDVYDLVTGEVYSRTKSSPLIIPENAVVVPGARIIDSHSFSGLKLSLQTPIIVKYNDSDNSCIKAEKSLRLCQDDLMCFE